MAGALGPCALGPEDRVVLAVSGGADSTALLLAWVEAAAAGLLPPPAGVAHLHHGMRGAIADEDMAHVGTLARRAGVEFVAGHAALAGANEAEARAVRYGFLEHAAGRCEARAVATAHHADDQAETLLLRILRGTSVDGLAGIPPRRALSDGVSVVRPLLSVTRAEIEDYLVARAATSRHDATNDDPKYPRTRLRRLLPELAEGFNPRLTDALLRLGRHAAHDREVLEGLADTLEREAIGAEDALDANALAAAPPAIRRRVLMRWIRRQVPEGAREEALVDAWVERLEALAAEGGAATLPGDVLVDCGVDRLLRVVRPVVVASRPAPVGLHVPGRTPWNGIGVIEADWVDASAIGVGVRGEAWLPARLGAGPLVVRCAEPGDRVAPLGMGGAHRLVRDLLREQRIPADRRAGWPLVVQGDDVLWVVGGVQSERARVAAGDAQVLRLRMGN